MAEHVFVTGATGFIGSSVVPALRSAGHAVNALARHGDVPDARTVRGGLFDPDALADGLRDAAAVVHLVGIIAEQPGRGVTFDRIHDHGTAAVVAAARAAGVRRFVYVSAEGAAPHAASAYSRTKFAAEQHVRTSGLPWTIFRPSLVHGPDGAFTRQMAGWARGRLLSFLCMPYFGAGPLGLGRQYEVQPLFVNDLARAIAESITLPAATDQIIPVGGPDRMTWPAMYRTAAEAIVGRRRATLAIPAWYATLLTRVVPRPLLPFNRAQVQMSQADSVCDLSTFTEAFGWTPRAFGPTLAGYADALR